MMDSQVMLTQQLHLQLLEQLSYDNFDGSANTGIASTDLSNTSNITLNDATQTLTNKTLTSPVIAAITSTADIDLTATNDVNIPANVGLTFGDDGEKIEGDGTNLTITSSGKTINDSGNIELDAASGIVDFISNEPFFIMLQLQVITLQ